MKNKELYMKDMERTLRKAWVRNRNQLIIFLPLPYISPKLINLLTKSGNIPSIYKYFTIG